MYYQAINNADKIQDTLKTVAKAADQGKNSIGNINFDLNLIGSHGVLISILGYFIVFVALVILFYFISLMTKALTISAKKKLRKKGDLEADTKEVNISGEINAAISMAIIMHFQEAHDFENTVLTIEEVRRRYSPWSSKLYSLRQYPTRR